MRQIRSAEIKDIPAILEILQQNLMANQKMLTPAELAAHGFLKNGFTEAEASDAILDTNDFIFCVATDEEEIIGYVTGCSVSKLKPSFQEILAAGSSELYNLVYQQKSLYLRHIAKKAGIQQVGQALLDALLSAAKLKDYRHMICQIMLEPIINKPSLAFHQKNGFVQKGENRQHGERWGIFSRSI